MVELALNASPVFLPRGPRAVLLLHGFTSTPSSWVPIAEKLAAAGYTVSLPLLPGHGQVPAAMKGCTGSTWLDFVLAEYDRLAATHPRPAVAGLSMGATLALHVARNRPVPAVVALAPALYLRDWRLAFLPIIKYLLPWQPAISNDLKNSELREQAYSRYPTRCVYSLLEVMRVVREELPQITAPLLTMQSQEDHVVPPSCMDDLLRWVGSSVKVSQRLTNSYHVVTLDQEYPVVADRMREFLDDQFKA